MGGAGGGGDGVGVRGGLGDTFASSKDDSSPSEGRDKLGFISLPGSVVLLLLFSIGFT